MKVKPFTSKYHKRMYRVLDAENMEVIDDNKKMGYSTQEKAMRSFFFRLHHLDKIEGIKARNRYIEILEKYPDFQKGKKDKEAIKKYRNKKSNSNENKEQIIDTADSKEFDNYDVKTSKKRSLKTVADKKEIHFEDLNYFSSERTINDYAMYAPKEQKKEIINKISKMIIKLSAPKKKEAMENSLCLDLFDELQIRLSKAKEAQNVTNISQLIQSYFKFKRSAIINGRNSKGSSESKCHC